MRSRVTRPEDRAHSFSPSLLLRKEKKENAQPHSVSPRQNPRHTRRHCGDAAGQRPPLTLLVRHAHGDWGALHQDDQLANEKPLRCGMRILSAYVLPTGDRIWIITETDRSATTLLTLEEY